MRQAVVIGASGGIGAALAAHLVAGGAFQTVYGFSRSAGSPPPGVTAGRIDLTDEASIAAAASRVRTAQLVIVATGALQTDRMRPERTYRALDPESMLEAFRINTLGPALVAKHFLPLLPKDKLSVFACLSARVGSISDNRLGGWHSYRASKAALNMIIRTLAVELSRERPLTICVGLHPGTVETPLSQPFQRSVRPEQMFTPGVSAAHLLDVLSNLTPADSGHVLAWDGSRVPA